MVGGMALIPQIMDKVGVPVIAAGGIAGGIINGRGILASLALGAVGVQMGLAKLDPNINLLTVCSKRRPGTTWRWCPRGMLRATRPFYKDL